MVMAAENFFVVKRHQTLFKMPDHKHAPAEIKKSFAREIGEHDYSSLSA